MVRYQEIQRANDKDRRSMYKARISNWCHKKSEARRGFLNSPNQHGEECVGGFKALFSGAFSEIVLNILTLSFKLKDESKYNYKKV